MFDQYHSANGFKDLVAAKNGWIAYYLSQNDAQVDTLKLAVQDLYLTLGIPIDTAQIEICNGPAHVAESLEEYCKQIERSAKKVENLSDMLFGWIQKMAQTLLDQSKSLLPLDSWQELQNMLFWDINFQVCHSVVSPVLHKLTQMGHVSYGSAIRPATSPCLGDADWLNFYRILREQCALNVEVPFELVDFIDAGGFYLYAFSDKAIVCTAPWVVLRDDEFRLHGEGEPAVQWHDGTLLYFHHGVAVPDKLIEAPEEVTKEDIVAEENAEVRRCYQEILGSERFGNLLGLELIDKDVDRFGNDLGLYKTAQRDKLAGTFIYFAEVVCPSTQRRYFLCVPPHLRSAREAVAWTFGKSADEYQPDIET